MLKFFTKARSQKGFTLIELIVVIAVIGILATILLPKFTDFTDRAREKAVLSEAKNIATVIDVLYAEDGKYYTNLETLSDGTTAEAYILNQANLTGQGTLVLDAAGGFTWTSTADKTSGYSAGRTATGRVVSPAPTL